MRGADDGARQSVIVSPVVVGVLTERLCRRVECTRRGHVIKVLEKARKSVGNMVRFLFVLLFRADRAHTLRHTGAPSCWGDLHCRQARARECLRDLRITQALIDAPLRV